MINKYSMPMDRSSAQALEPGSLDGPSVRGGSQLRRIVIAGGSGFLGTLLARHFVKAGRNVTVLSRAPQYRIPGVREVPWDARTIAEWTKELEGADAIINLVGRSVNCRYHARNRNLMLNSRIESTRILGQAIACCRTPPKVWMNASTATIYKHNFGKPWDESGVIQGTPEARDEFSVQIATEWERAQGEANTPGTRKIALRAAMVLGRAANSVYPMLTRLTRLGLGGRMGSGRQYASWIHESDFCRAVDWLLGHEDLRGPINICAPNPLTNAEMMRTFREINGMPIGLPALNWMLEIGAFLMRTETELIIKSRRVAPRRLTESGFAFRYPLLRDALAELRARK